MTRILLVEDDQVVASDVTEILTLLKYEVVAKADRGSEAIQKAISLLPDLILMDVGLKGDMDGVVAAGKILDKINVPIIFVTGLSDGSVLERAKRIGVYGYLTKPYKTSMLHSAIETTLYKFELDKKLLESERKYRTLFDTISDSVLIFDKISYRILDCNATAVTTYGYSRDQWLSMNLLDLHPADDKEKVKKNIETHNIGHPNRYRHKNSNGRLFDVEISTTDILYDGKLALISVVRNISDRVKAEMDIQKRAIRSELMYQVSKQISGKLELHELLNEIVTKIYSAFNYYGVMLLMKGGEGALVLKTIAGGYADVFPEDLSIGTGEGMIGEAARTGDVQISGDVTKNPHYIMKADEITRSELSVPIKIDGKVIGVLDMQSNERDAFSEDDIMSMKTLARQIAGAIENASLYSELKKELSIRARAEREVTEAQVELIQILNTTAEGIRVIDKDLNITKVNKKFLEIVNLEESDVVGRKCYRILSCALCHTMQCPLFYFNESIESTEHDIKMHFHDSHSLETLLHLSPFRDHRGNLIGIVESIRDITDRKSLEIQLRNAQKLESIGQLAAGIAHEINTPTQYVGDNTRFISESFQHLSDLLSRIKTDAAYIREEKKEELSTLMEEIDLDFLLEEIPSALEQSMEGINRITYIVRAMKDFSHPGVQDKTSVDINRALESTITISRNEWKYVADLETQFDPDLPHILCEPGQVNQVFLNLIINAAHAIQEKQGEGSEEKGVITISTSKVGDDRIEVRVSDTGNGIPDEVKTKIFTPFFTTKEIGKGTGQGLAIAHSVIVDKHGGSIRFESSVGKGTEFIVRLPVHGNNR